VTGGRSGAIPAVWPLTIARLGGLAVIGLLCVSLASSLSGQAIGAELYGDFRYAVGHSDRGDESGWAAVNNGSRLGVRGEASEHGFAIFVDLQAGIAVDAEAAAGPFTQRYYLAGLRGPFGTVTAGRQSPDYKMAGLRLDPFYDTSTLAVTGAPPTAGLHAVGSYGLSRLANGFADRVVRYVTPSFRGIAANAAVHLDPGSGHDYGLGLGYRAGGWDAGVHYYSPGGDASWVQAAGIAEAIRFHALFTRDADWSLGASHERINSPVAGRQDFIYLRGTIDPLPRSTLAAAVGHAGRSGAVEPVTGTAVHLGLFHTLLPGLRAHVLYSRLAPHTGDAPSSIALGVVYSFVVQ
jgi:hypothetical protein